MIPRNRRTGSSAAAWGRGDETESLHTDVMRFMAILGLCLTAVFALVQSISVQQSGHDTRVAHEDVPETGVVQLEERVEGLRLELERLTEDTRRAMENREIATQALTSAREQLAVTISDTEQKTEERNRIRGELAVMQRELQQRRRELDRIRQVTRAKQDSLAGLSHRLKQEHEALDHIEKRVRAVQLKRESRKVRAVVAKPVPSRVDPTKQGFTLRFDSPEALDRLVKSGEVALYVMTGKQAWRVTSGAGNPVFVNAVFPRKFHEMATDTVPARYVGALTRSVPGANTTAVVWGVKLPEHTEQRIVMLAGKLTGGTLVIGPEGEVNTRQDRDRE